MAIEPPAPTNEHKPKVTTSLAKGVFTITLADPDRRNALSRQLSRELSAAIDEAETNDTVRVVVVTNDGNTFCAGADLSERSGSDESAAAQLAAEPEPDPLGFFGRIRRSRKPYVGRIKGHAVAGGLGLAAAMDISVAIDTAKMGFSEVRIGVAPAIISVVCLPKMRASDASAAFLRGNRFLAPEAQRLGLINHAVPAAELDTTVDSIVTDLLLGGPNALAASKQLINDVTSMPFDEAIIWAQKLSARLFESAEGQQGMQAFLDKRNPNWVL